MATDTATETDAAAAKEAERAKKAEEREAERARKAEEREAAKAKKAEEAAAAKAAREQEKIAKVLAELPEDKRPERGDGEDGAVTLTNARDAVKAFKAEERANRPKKAPLTLSQRRAMLVLAEAGETGVVPKTGFNALPLDYLVGVELAETFETTRTEKYQETVEKEVTIPKDEREEGGPTKKTVKEKVDKEREVDATGYRLTEKGRERAGEVNPKWKTWKPESATPAATEEQPAA